MSGNAIAILAILGFLLYDNGPPKVDVKVTFNKEAKLRQECKDNGNLLVIISETEHKCIEIPFIKF